MNMKSSILALFVAAPAPLLNAADIDWAKVDRFDAEEVAKVTAIRIAAATNCINTIGYAKQFVQVVPDYVAYAQGFWRTNGPQTLTIRGEKYDRYEIVMLLDVWFDSTLTNAVRFGEPNFYLT